MFGPKSDRLEGFLPADIEDHDNNITVLVVETQKRPILLLTCCIPDINRDSLAIGNFAIISLETRAHGTCQLMRELVVDEIMHNGSLAHT